MDSAPRSYQYLNVVISDEGLTEMQGTQRVVFVAREQVKAVEVRFGPQAEHPLAQGILGALLAVVGVMGIAFVVHAGWSALRWELGFIFFGCVGLWLLWETAKRRHYLRVICAAEERKVVFLGRVQQLELRKFLEDAAQLGYEFKFCIEADEAS